MEKLAKKILVKVIICYSVLSLRNSLKGLLLHLYKFKFTFLKCDFYTIRKIQYIATDQK